jgi:hypothetical protein
MVSETMAGLAESPPDDLKDSTESPESIDHPVEKQAVSASARFAEKSGSDVPSPKAIELLGGSSGQNKGLQINKNSFYNEETIKYMRIIDRYKDLGVGKEMKPPRACTPSRSTQTTSC